MLNHLFLALKRKAFLINPGQTNVELAFFSHLCRWVAERLLHLNPTSSQIQIKGALYVF